jgi:hypothetical protein
VQHEPLRSAAPCAQESFDREPRIERATRKQSRLSFERHRIDLGTHVAQSTSFHRLRFMQHAECDHVDSGRRLAQGVALDEPPGKLHAICRVRGRRGCAKSLDGRRQAAGAAEAAPASAAGASPPRSISDLAFSSFIIGEGVVTARGIFTIK